MDEIINLIIPHRMLRYTALSSIQIIIYISDAPRPSHNINLLSASRATDVTLK